MIRIHKEVKINGEWLHESVISLKELDDEQVLSILGRYCLGTVILPDERCGTQITALDFSYSEKNIGTNFFLRSDDIARLRKVWGTYFGDFDTQIGYFMWDTGDIIAFPEEMSENKRKWHFEDYRMFIWNQ